jgi:hypothetical protein
VDDEDYAQARRIALAAPPLTADERKLIASLLPAVPGVVAHASIMRV